ncbi:hypothetical protein L210DRAFT_3611834 [Boletus edulis BED1]|uniref:Store-operated calcium entry-associated regulatory factor n=1 Tax=Boletus edulis BED1 TaxID=1328754 RepID=A0AAD4BXU1_BOLED|nr:hypothetical protein L210DRAFT_3611834 [Boletus edulis BED1]
MSRIALENIPAITFYKGSVTAARRTAPIAQLVCLGKPCAMYQPEVVRCRNIGGSGVNVDWKCEADLPSSLRFGKVEVSCEGWSGPGDPYVMKGSCCLEYHLVQLPHSLRDDVLNRPSFGIPNWFKNLDTSGILFMLVWFAVLAIILYNSCLRRTYPPTGNTQRVPPPTYPGSDDYGRPGRGFFPGDYPGPPPPYTKDPSSTEGWRPGFWSGAALGALGGSLLNRSRSAPRPYDWEGSGTRFRTTRRRESVDRMEGSSNMGDMGPLRTSTGYGGSNSR